MRKFILSAIAIFGITVVSAQGGQTDEGSILIETSTGFGETPNTGFYLWSGNGNTNFIIGGDVGYFLRDDLALKAGINFRDLGQTAIGYKLGAKYYIESQFPVALDLTGSSIEDVDENPLFLGFQGGYAWFLSDHIAIEPGLRYNLTLNEDASDSIFELNIGIALFF